MQSYANRKLDSYPTFVACPIDTEDPTTVPDLMRTSDDSIQFACTTAPISIIAVGSMSEDWWKRPPPFFHLANSSESSAHQIEPQQITERRKGKNKN